RTSKASEDFPAPATPVMAVTAPTGMSTLPPFRLCWRAQDTGRWEDGALGSDTAVQRNRGTRRRQTSVEQPRGHRPRHRIVPFRRPVHVEAGVEAGDALGGPPQVRRHIQARDALARQVVAEGGVERL